MLLQSPSGTQEIDLKCLQGNKPVKKKEINFRETKSTNTLPIDVSNGKQPQQSSTHQS